MTNRLTLDWYAAHYLAEVMRQWKDDGRRRHRFRDSLIKFCEAIAEAEDKLRNFETDSEKPPGSELWSVRVDRPARENRVSSGRCNKDDTATPCT